MGRGTQRWRDNRDIEREGDAERDGDTERGRQRERETGWRYKLEIQRETEMETQTEMETERQMETRSEGGKAMGGGRPRDPHCPLTHLCGVVAFEAAAHLCLSGHRHMVALGSSRERAGGLA